MAYLQLPLSLGLMVMDRVEGMAMGVLWRIIGTIIIFTSFLVGSLVYVGFYTNGFSFGQRIIVVLVALIIAFASIAIMWVTWANRRGWIPRKWME